MTRKMIARHNKDKWSFNKTRKKVARHDNGETVDMTIERPFYLCQNFRPTPMVKAAVLKEMDESPAENASLR